MSDQPSYVMNTYARFEEEFVRGEGVYLYDGQGRRYLDCYAGIAVNGLGHCHPHLVKSLQDQAAKLWHISNLFPIADQEKLAERLAQSSFADRVFFCNSGVEAMEGLIKLARSFHAKAGNPEKWRVITVQGAFHGRSLATISAAANPKYVEGFGPSVDGFDNVPFANMNALRAAITEETAAILVEPIQGEGGIRAMDLDYLRDLRMAADEFGLLLIMDEIQTGNGRTGKMWAHEWADIAPDAMATAKGLGGGFPVGAILATEKAAQGMEPGKHGTTFGGNPLAMAVGNAVLDVMEEEGFFDSVQKSGAALRVLLDDMVAKHPDIFVSSRGAGMMLGLTCHEDVTNIDVIKAFKSEGLLTVGAAENVIRFLPPLIMTEAHIAEAGEMMDRAVAALKAA